MRTERGFATLETLVASAFVVVFMSAGLGAVYLSFARAWLDRSAYEASVCLATDATASICENELRRSISGALPIGRLSHVMVRRTPAFVEVDGRWSLKAGQDLTFEDRRSLPLNRPERGRR
ncbi:MAG: hypothetical protein V4760_13420 [Bdellovibrionota bacterium]